jgi:excisionase family DNA binding protein
MPATDPPIMLSTSEVARHLDVSVETIRRYARTGVLPARQYYPGARLRFLLDDVEQLRAPGPRLLDGDEREAA